MDKISEKDLEELIKLYCDFNRGFAILTEDNIKYLAKSIFCRLIENKRLESSSLNYESAEERGGF